MSDKKEKMSAALTLIKLVWDHNREGTGFSWQRLNSSMFQAVMLAIDAGMGFDPGDFCYIASQFRIGRWGGTVGHMLGEQFYSRAVEMRHPSAYQSFETWKERRPLIIDGDRLYIGKQFQWQAKNVTCTSFSEDGSYAVAVERSYENLKWKVERRFKITRDDIIKFNQARRLAEKQRAAIQEACDKLANGKLYKIILKGRSCHGGNLKWSLPKKDKPGDWHEVTGALALCSNGIHLAKNPAGYFGPEHQVYEAEYDGEWVGDGDKICVRRARLVRQLDPSELGLLVEVAA